MQLVYLGVTSTPGGNVPSDPALAACIAIPIAVKANMDPNLAIALAIPFGVIGVFLDQLRRTLNAAWVHMADKHAETANMSAIMRCAFSTRRCWGWYYVSQWCSPPTTSART